MRSTTVSKQRRGRLRFVSWSLMSRGVRHEDGYANTRFCTVSQEQLLPTGPCEPPWTCFMLKYNSQDFVLCRGGQSAWTRHLCLPPGSTSFAGHRTNTLIFRFPRSNLTSRRVLAVAIFSDKTSKCQLPFPPPAVKCMSMHARLIAGEGSWLNRQIEHLPVDRWAICGTASLTDLDLW